MVSISQATESIQIAFAQELFREYVAWFCALVPGSESDPAFHGWEDEVEAIPGVCVPPRRCRELHSEFGYRGFQL